MSSYKVHFRSQFERLLSELCAPAPGEADARHPYLSWDEVSGLIERDAGVPVTEFVYRLWLTSCVHVLVYSSVDRETERTREVNSDAVRVVFVWDTRNGYRYSHIDKRLRVKGLINNLRTSLLEASRAKADLSAWGGWADTVQEALACDQRPVALDASPSLDPRRPEAAISLSPEESLRLDLSRQAAHGALDAAEKAWHAYAATCPLGPERTRAFEVFEIVRTARRPV